MEKSEQTFDVVILGAGVIGLVCAHLLANLNFKCLIVDQRAQDLPEKNIFSSSVLSLNGFSKNLLDKIGVWKNLSTENYGQIKKLLAWDDQGGGTVEFDTKETAQNTLAYTVETNTLLSVLQNTVSENITYFFNEKITSLAHKDNHLSLTLTQEQKINTPLLVGADGADSWVCKQMGIQIKKENFQQTALLCIVETEMPHQFTGWQAFIADGTLALLPLADIKQCAVIWCMQEKRAADLLTHPHTEINQTINNEFGLRLGHLQILSEIKTTPIFAQHAESLIADNMVLIGDAAEKIHPLAGQGANLGIQDAFCLAETLKKAKNIQRDLGNYALLRKYERSRKKDHLLLRYATNAFLKIFTDPNPWLIQTRSMGFNLTNRLNFIKKIFVGYASGLHHSVD